MGVGKLYKRLGKLLFFSIICVFLIMKNIRGQQGNIKASAVYGRVMGATVVYDKIDGTQTDVIEKNSVVEILKDRSERWYYVGYSNKKGWIRSCNLYIEPDPKTNACRLTTKEIESFSDEYFKSNTDYCVWVDIDRQRVYVLKNNNGWCLERTIICATGKNKTPTVRGFFKIGDRGKWFYSERLNSGAKYWVRFSDSYLFHSVAMNKQGEIIDPVLGQRRSSGCVRMGVEDAEWFYNNIPVDTTVFVF